MLRHGAIGLAAAVLALGFVLAGTGAEDGELPRAASGTGPTSGTASPGMPRATGPSALAAARRISRGIGSRPAGGRNERRAHRYVARQFRAAGLEVSIRRFRVPGPGRSRNVIGALEGRARCLHLLMAHTDSVPPGPGANDNASGVGVLVALAHRLRSAPPACDLWLVATGAEERPVTGTGYHVGAAALVRTLKRSGRARDLRFALSVDMVGRGKRFSLRSPRRSARRGVERPILAAARRARVKLRWMRDSGQGNSDHREFELAGLPAAVIQVWRGRDRCHHEGCDRPGRLQKRSLNRVQRVLQRLVEAG